MRKYYYQDGTLKWHDAIAGTTGKASEEDITEYEADEARRVAASLLAEPRVDYPADEAGE